MSAPDEIVLRLNGVSVFDQARKQLTPAIDLSVPAATVVAVVGPNASLVRKFLRVMAAVDRAAQGTLELFGDADPLRGRVHYKQLRSRLGYMIGESSLLPIYNGLINVMLPALYHQRSRSFKHVSRDARALLDELGCSFDTQILPHAMSRFQQSLIELARVLMLAPEILYIEEPFSHLTTDDRRLFSEKLMAVRDRIHSKCIIMSTDYLGFIRQHADQVLFVDGACVEVFNHWEAFSSSRIPPVAQYLGRESVDATDPATAIPGF